MDRQADRDDGDNETNVRDEQDRDRSGPSSSTRSRSGPDAFGQTAGVYIQLARAARAPRHPVRRTAAVDQRFATRTRATRDEVLSV